MKFLKQNLTDALRKQSTQHCLKSVFK